MNVRGLYPIIDVDAWRAQGIELSQPHVLESIAQTLLVCRPFALQLRAKHEPAEHTLSLLKRLRPLCFEQNVPLVMNDRVDLALLGNADWVHIGIDDLPIQQVRAIAPNLGVGQSTHSLEQLHDALAQGPTYVAFGPIFPTHNKKNAEPIVGVQTLAKASALAQNAKIPLVAIGGISLDTLPFVREAQVFCAAVIGELVMVKNNKPALSKIEERACEMHQKLCM